MKSSSLLPNLPHAPGVYLMRDKAGAIIYIGKARDLKKRVDSYFSKSTSSSATSTLHPRIQVLVSQIRHVDYVSSASEREALVLERRLIHKFKPIYNVMWRDDKSYPYLALTVKEDFPRLFLTRKRKNDGTIYFGPYPSVRRVRELLRWAWRKKIFPLRPCDLDLKEKNPLPYEKVRWCLYLHTGECSAPCMGKISSRRYKKIVDRAKLFFRGRQNKLISQWEKEMARMSRKKRFEEAADLRDRISALHHVQEPVTFREMEPADLDRRMGESRAVQSLMKVLKLKKPPQRMECFDISHVQGVEKVASMVTFNGGRPAKAGYRKFIIRSVEGIDDFKSMAEVVRRRYGRLKREKAPYPDLILVDGGKGQLSSALGSLKELNIKDIPLAALAKDKEEVFLPGRSKSIRLPLDSPALNLLRYIRDEAHRFAITFHRQRRGARTYH